MPMALTYGCKSCRELSKEQIHSNPNMTTESKSMPMAHEYSPLKNTNVQFLKY